MIFQKTVSLESKAFDTIYDITRMVQAVVAESGVSTGMVNVFNIGSTASITTIEFEPGLERDVPEFLNKILPRGEYYHHNDTWGDGNGDGHMKATLIGPSLTCPVSEQEVLLGTWQQIILIDSDNKPRHRNIVVTVMGE